MQRRIIVWICMLNSCRATSSSSSQKTRLKPGPRRRTGQDVPIPRQAPPHEYQFVTGMQPRRAELVYSICWWCCVWTEKAVVGRLKDGGHPELGHLSQRGGWLEEWMEKCFQMEEYPCLLRPGVPTQTIMTEFNQGQLRSTCV